MQLYFHPVQIPGTTLPGNIFLAPMAGFTDRAFRSVCIDGGAAFTYTEMVSAEALARGNVKTVDLMRPAENERVFAVQIFASNPDQAGKAAVKAAALSPALIDLNCGCPVPKIIKAGCGSALLRNPALIREIVSAVSAAVNIPVSVKIRSGWDAASINYLETASQAIAGGAVMIGFHPRTRAQGYGGRADWDHLRILKNEFPEVPVIGTGDLWSSGDALSMMKSTGCDGVMFARGALGNPFVFTETRNLFQGIGQVTSPGPAERLRTAWIHYERLVLDKGERTASREMRKHFCSYTRGIPGGAAFRNRIVHAETIAEYRAILDDFTAEIGEQPLLPESGT